MLSKVFHTSGLISNAKLTKVTEIEYKKLETSRLVKKTNKTQKLQKLKTNYQMRLTWLKKKTAFDIKPNETSNRVTSNKIKQLRDEAKLDGYTTVFTQN